jgi:hypothetical protein
VRVRGKAVSNTLLPPRLAPQNKLGLGLAVYLLLSRFDDHLLGAGIFMCPWSRQSKKLSHLSTREIALPAP